MWQWIKDLFMWRKTQRFHADYDLSVLDHLNTKLEEAVIDTTKISQRIIKKLEARVDEVEEQLSEREQLLSEVFATIPDILCLKDGAGRWLLLNAYGKKTYGITGNSYKNKTDAEIAELSPRYATALTQCVKTDEEAWELGRPLQVEERTTDSFGLENVFDVTKTPVFRLDGTRDHLLVHGRNVTEEVQNTKHIRMLLTALNKASDAITVTDQDHIIIYANEAFIQNYGYELSEVIDYPRKLVASGLTSKETYQIMHDTISRGEVWTGNMINKTKSGTLLHETVTITPVLNGKPYPIYYIGVNRQIERRKEVRVQLS